MLLNIHNHKNLLFIFMFFCSFTFFCSYICVISNENNETDVLPEKLNNFSSQFFSIAKIQKKNYDRVLFNCV